MESPQGSKRKRLSKASSWLAEHIAAAIVGLVVTAAIGAIAVWFVGHQETTGQQLDHLRASLAREELVVTGFRRLRLHPGAKSVLLTLAGRPGLEPDELRIYDEESSDLIRRLVFRPKIKGRAASRIGIPTSFNIMGVVDPFGDGLGQVLGTYDLESANASVRVPFMIGWDAQDETYDLVPVLAVSPEIPRGSSPMTRQGLLPFEHPFVFKDQNLPPLPGWGAEDAVLIKEAGERPSTEDVVLGLSYPSPTQKRSYRIKGRQLQLVYISIGDLSSGQPAGMRVCWEGGDIATGRVGEAEEPEDVLERTWRRLSALDQKTRRGEVQLGEGRALGVRGLGKECFYGE